jgi:hypothetical protein
MRAIQLPEKVPSILLNSMLIFNELRIATKNRRAKRAFARLSQTCAESMAEIMLQGHDSVIRPIAIPDVAPPENLPRRLTQILEEIHQWASEVTK